MTESNDDLLETSASEGDTPPDLRLCSEDMDELIALERHATHLGHPGFKKSFAEYRKSLTQDLLREGRYVFRAAFDASLGFEELLKTSGIEMNDVDVLIAEANFPIRADGQVVRHMVAMRGTDCFDASHACRHQGWRPGRIEDLFAALPIIASVSQSCFPLLAIDSTLPSRDGRVCVAAVWHDRRLKLSLFPVPASPTRDYFLMVNDDRV